MNRHERRTAARGKADKGRGGAKRSPFAVALNHAAEGRFKDAERTCRALLSANPNDTNALLLLGTILLETGRGPEAVEMLERVPATDPTSQKGDPYRHFLLGKAYLLSRRLPEAAAAFGEALALKADYAEALGGRGAALAGLGRFAEAAADFTLALELDSGSLQAQSGLGHTLAGLGRSDEAVTAYTRALALAPDSPDLRARLAALLVDMGRAEEGLAESERALALAPGSGLILTVRGHALLALGRHDEGVEAMREASHAVPDPGALLRLAAALRLCGRLDEAVDTCRQALAQAPQEMDPYGQIVSVHQVHAALGLLLLAQGRFAEGWDHYRQRSEAPAPPLPADLSGETVVINGEDELGDALFFLRAIPALKARGAHVLLRCRAELSALVRRAEGVDGWIGPEEGLQGWHVAATDLPWSLGLTEPLPSARIAPLPERSEALAARLAAFGPPPYVVVSWGTESAALAEGIGRTLAARDVRVVLLQADGQARFAAGLGRPALDCSDADPEDTLALLAQADDLIAVGGALIHLRAAVGGLAHVLASHPPDFRWLAKGNHSPWFPGMTIHRQSVTGDWDDAVESLTRLLP